MKTLWFFSLPVIADALAPEDLPNHAGSSDGYMTWLILGMLAICIGVSIWAFVSSKRKKK